MDRSRTGNAARRRGGSAPPGPRHTSTVGALLHHDPKPPRRDHGKDNRKAIKEKERQLKASRDEAAKTTPAFKLKQFKNVPPRVSSRPSSAPARRSSAPATPTDVDSSFLSKASSKQSRRHSVGSPESSVLSQGWRVASGYGSLSTPPPAALATPPATPPRHVGRSPQVQATPPRNVVRSPQVRACSTPVKSTRCRSASRERSASKTQQPCDGGVAYGCDEEIGLDVARFDQVARNLKEMQCRRTPTKDGQGQSTQCQSRGSSMYGLLSHEELDKSEIPAGYRLAPEEERLETLGLLQKKHADLCDAYDRLPLRIETEGQRQKQQLLRDKIAETERAAEVFSRSRVFVEM